MKRSGAPLKCNPKQSPLVNAEWPEKIAMRTGHFSSQRRGVLNRTRSSGGDSERSPSPSLSSRKKSRRSSSPPAAASTAITAAATLKDDGDVPLAMDDEDTSCSLPLTVTAPTSINSATVNNNNNDNNIDAAQILMGFPPPPRDKEQKRRMKNRVSIIDNKIVTQLSESLLISLDLLDLSPDMAAAA